MTGCRLYIFGDDWGATEEFVPAENFTVEEISSGRRIDFLEIKGKLEYIKPLTVSLGSRRISLNDVAQAFCPPLSKVSICSSETASSVEYTVPDAFALVKENGRELLRQGIYGEVKEGTVTALYSDGLLKKAFLESFHSQVVSFSKRYNLIWMQQGESLLDTRLPDLLTSENIEKFS